MARSAVDLDQEILIAERAADWLNRLEAADAREREAFFKWLSRSPEHGGETLIATSTHLVMRQVFCHRRIDVDQFVSASANVLTVADAAHLTHKPSRRRWRLGPLAAAGLGLVAAIVVLVVTPYFIRSRAYQDEYTTSVGEQRAIELPDGSEITINRTSNVRIAFSATARDAYLDSGQAMFAVETDPLRPFRVHVNTSSSAPRIGKAVVVQALGTKFEVRCRADRVEVSVIEGSVRIFSDAERRAFGSATVVAGQTLSIESTGLITYSLQ